jgi:hypothetical protein
MAPIVNEPTAVSTTDDDLDLAAFIKDLEVVEEESGCQVAGAGTTDTSSRYNAQQKKLVQSYVDFLGKCRLSIAIGYWYSINCKLIFILIQLIVTKSSWNL